MNETVEAYPEMTPSPVKVGALQWREEAGATEGVRRFDAKTDDGIDASVTAFAGFAHWMLLSSHGVRGGGSEGCSIFGDYSAKTFEEAARRAEAALPRVRRMMVACGLYELTTVKLDALLFQVDADFAETVESNDWRKDGDGDAWLDEVVAEVAGAWADELDLVASDVTALVAAHRPMLRERLDGEIVDYVDNLKSNCGCTVGAGRCSTCRVWNE